MPLRLAAIPLVCASILAQESRPASRPAGVPFATKDLVARQADDGAWPGGSVEGESDRRTTALALLALLAEGSTLREGLHRGSVRKAAAWAQRQQDPEGGRIGSADGNVATDALWAFVLMLSCHSSRYKPLQNHAERAAAYAIRQLPGAPDSPEALAWLALTVATARAGGLAVDAGPIERWLTSRAAPAARPSSDLALAAELLACAVLDAKDDARIAGLAGRTERWHLRDAGPERAVDARAMLFAGLAFLALEDQPGFAARLEAWCVRIEAALAEPSRTSRPASRAGASEVETLAMRLLLDAVRLRHARLVERR